MSNNDGIRILIKIENLEQGLKIDSQDTLKENNLAVKKLEKMFKSSLASNQKSEFFKSIYNSST